MKNNILHLPLWHRGGSRRIRCNVREVASQPFTGWEHVYMDMVLKLSWRIPAPWAMKELLQVHHPCCVAFDERSSSLLDVSRTGCCSFLRTKGFFYKGNRDFQVSAQTFENTLVIAVVCFIKIRYTAFHYQLTWPFLVLMSYFSIYIRVAWNHSHSIYSVPFYSCSSQYHSLTSKLP